MKCSIIVCTYNRCESLKDTLMAIGSQVPNDDLNLEIIVVDNNSADQTKAVVTEMQKQSKWPLRYVFEGTQGLSYARNRGVCEANGDLVVFTDDDVIPKEDWVSRLMGAFEKNDADAVGGPVLPIWLKMPPEWLSDKQRQFGLLALLDRGPKVVVADSRTSGSFLAGANMAFKKSLFDEFGGFRTDVGMNGRSLMRGEESEFLYRAISSSKRVIYTPDAVVRHKISPERMTLSYMRRLLFAYGRSMVRISKFNHGIFKEVLADCFISGIACVFNCLRGARIKGIGVEENFWRKLGMLVELVFGAVPLRKGDVRLAELPRKSRILFVVPRLPYPPHTGGQLRSWHFLRYLATKGTVTLVSIGRPEQYESHMPELKKYCEQVFLADPKKLESSQEMGRLDLIKNRFGKLARLQPWLLDDFVDPEILRQINLAKPEEHDLIVVRFSVMAYYLLTGKKFRPLLSRTIIDIDDVSTIVQERSIRKMKFGYTKMRSTFDLTLLRRYYRKFKQTKACLTAAAKDQEYLLKRKLARNVYVIPNMFEVNGRKLTPPEKVNGQEILFCGMMSYPPNQDAILFFVEKIFPKILERVPNAHLTIVGKHTPEKIMRFGTQPGITVAGYVPSMEPYYERASIVVVPLLNGGGTRIKILEAFAYERPVVSTSIGAEGLEVTHEKNILIADDPSEFADRCIELLRNSGKRQEIASNAYRLVKEKYDIPVFHKKMDEVFEFIKSEEKCQPSA